MKLYDAREFDEEESVLVVADNKSEAIEIGKAEILCDIESVEVSELTSAKLPEWCKKGIFSDYETALKNGWYDWIYAVCPVCKKNSCKIEWDGEKFYCRSCNHYFEEL